MTIIEKAIEAAGGASELAKKCGVHRTTVLFWKATGSIPMKRVLQVEKATGLPREDLCPPMFVRTEEAR